MLRGELSPVFFGSALTNFGVEPFLENFLRLTSAPLARVDSLTGEPVDPAGTSSLLSSLKFRPT